MRSRSSRTSRVVGALLLSGGNQTGVSHIHFFQILTPSCPSSARRSGGLDVIFGLGVCVVLCSRERALDDIPSLHLVMLERFCTFHYFPSQISSLARFPQSFRSLHILFRHEARVYLLGMSVPEVLSPCSSLALPAPPIFPSATYLHRAVPAFPWLARSAATAHRRCSCSQGRKWAEHSAS
jgi:hypothetical protein